MDLVFGFDHRHQRPPRELTALLGGKGANLAEMTSVLQLPVPPGFTITTDACRTYMGSGWPDGLSEQVSAALEALERSIGRRLGDPSDPLLVSVRSGAKFSMPGMMDTVLNLGLNDETVEGLAAQTDARFAFDSYRRFVQMYGTIVLGIEGKAFDEIFDAAKARAGAETDPEIPADHLREVVSQGMDLVRERTGAPFPQQPDEQLRGAIEAVFRSWGSPRARAYRRREHIPDDLGTAVNVQAMVFGNRDDRSGTGVAFTRNPATGDPEPYGDFLLNAQGEDVVAGIRVTEPLDAMADRFPELWTELGEIFDRLERHYRDMLDTEFTIEQGRLWMLQVRVGKRAGRAALKIAVDLHRDERIRLAPEEAVTRVQPEHLDQVLHPQMDRGDREVLATGLAASPGAAVGSVRFTADDAVAATERGERVILVREETSPEDVHGMEVAEGILTSRGGLVSHAAVVARGWGKPAVVGAEAIHIGERSFRVGEVVVSEGDVISIDGATGEVVLGEVELRTGAVPDELDTVLGWADEIRAGKLAVRANADTAADAARAREHGAEGIGLCRTEHMFLGERLPIVRRMILADTPQEERDALAELLEVQRSDFIEILEVMDGLPVTVRLLDPPLHEFLPDIDDLIASEARGELDGYTRDLFEAARDWREENPMLGTRGVRLGILKGGLYKMQVQALAEAVMERRQAGGDPRPQIMVPLVSTELELQMVRRWVEEELAEVLGDSAGVPIGTMIELPRAALRGDSIAEHADFFSFGTNDLTQMTFGFSRDDVERKLMPLYLDQGILARNPFETLDRDGVGELIRIAAERGRSARPDLELGVCGEHGGDPSSIAYFWEIGLDYVSCSPFRVPIARLAAAHAIVG